MMDHEDFPTLNKPSLQINKNKQNKNKQIEAIKTEKEINPS